MSVAEPAAPKKTNAQRLMEYGLIAAISVWAAVVALMAYHLDESPWRWAFIALSVGGFATIGGIFKIRKYVDNLTKTPQLEKRS